MCSLEREEAEDLIKRHGGRITSAVSKKTVSFIFKNPLYITSAFSEDTEGFCKVSM